MNTTNTPSTPVATGDNTTATGRPWPATSEWNDDDYNQFVQLFSQGAFPETRNDPTFWDQHFIPAGNDSDSLRPTVISHHDFHHHLPATWRGRHGFLVLKLWEIARAKGYTKAYEEQIQQAALQQAEARAAAEKQQLLQEIQSIQGNLPTPEPNPIVDPRQQWYDQILAAAIPGAKLIEKVKHVQQAVLDGQPYRNSLLNAEATKLVEDTFGPFMLPESHDAMANPIPPNDKPEPVLKKWSPKASTAQIVRGAARDLADLVSLLIARQRVAVGFEADRHTINQAVQLTHSLRELSQITHQPPPKKRGRPRKERFVNPELLGENTAKGAEF